MSKYIEKDFKTVINKRNNIDSWFWEKYGITPYNGCEHNCIYCDSRSQKYYLHENFGEEIVVKKNLSEMLDVYIRNSRNLNRDIVGICASSDPYQPAEKIYMNTRNILSVLNKYKFPVHILTKSELILRDTDILGEIVKNNWCTVGVTITSADKKISAFLEPKASSPAARFDIIKKLKSRNISAGVLFMPVVPCFCDKASEMEDLIKKAKDSGSDFILFGAGVTLRDKQAVYFLNKISDHFPEHIKDYEVLYEFKYKSDSYNGKYTPKSEYAQKTGKIIAELCEKHGLNIRMKRYIPDDYRKNNYILSEKMFNHCYYINLSGKQNSNLFFTAQKIQNLSRPVNDYISAGRLKDISDMTPETEKFILNHITDERTHPTLF